MALSAVTLSLTANVAHWSFVDVGAAVLGAVPPVMLAALLLTMHRHGATAKPHQDARAESVPVPVRTDAQDHPQPGPPAGPVPPRTRRPRTVGAGKRAVPDHILLDQIREREQTTGPLSKRTVMKEFHVGNDRAIRQLRTARNGHDVDPAPATVHP